MNKPISPLRQRMLDDMTFRNMAPTTKKVYSSAVANFSASHGRSPDKLGIEDVRAYRLHLIERSLKATSVNLVVGALQFFYGTTLGRKEIAEQIPFAHPSSGGAGPVQGAPPPKHSLAWMTPEDRHHAVFDAAG